MMLQKFGLDNIAYSNITSTAYRNIKLINTSLIEREMHHMNQNCAVVYFTICRCITFTLSVILFSLTGPFLLYELSEIWRQECNNLSLETLAKCSIWKSGDAGHHLATLILVNKIMNLCREWMYVLWLVIRNTPNEQTLSINVFSEHYIYIPSLWPFLDLHLPKLKHHCCYVCL